MPYRPNIRVELSDYSRQFGDVAGMDRFDNKLCARFKISVGGVDSYVMIPAPPSAKPDDDDFVAVMKSLCRDVFTAALSQTAHWAPPETK